MHCHPVLDKHTMHLSDLSLWYGSSSAIPYSGEEYISQTPFIDNLGGHFCSWGPCAAGAFRFVDFSQNCDRRFGLNFHNR